MQKSVIDSKSTSSYCRTFLRFVKYKIVVNVLRVATSAQCVVILRGRLVTVTYRQSVNFGPADMRRLDQFIGHTLSHTVRNADKSTVHTRIAKPQDIRRPFHSWSHCWFVSRANSSSLTQRTKSKRWRGRQMHKLRTTANRWRYFRSNFSFDVKRMQLIDRRMARAGCCI
jgi:hypothetical protein